MKVIQIVTSLLDHNEFRSCSPQKMEIVLFADYSFALFTNGFCIRSIFFICVYKTRHYFT